MRLEEIKEGEPYILIEGPRWGDAEFYGRWLLAAAKAEALWKKAIKDPSFEEQIGSLTAMHIPVRHWCDCYALATRGNLLPSRSS